MSVIDTSFNERTAEYFRRSREEARSWFNDQGQWATTNNPLGTRERFWLSFAPYATGDSAFADMIVRAADVNKTHMGESVAGSTFDIFHTNISVALLVQHRHKMAADVRALLEKLALDVFAFKPGDRQPDYQFHGYNDNMPAKATMGLILAGELLDNPAAVEHGLWNLRQMRAMLTRRGINSESNSPTYSPLTIHAMGEIVEHSRNDEARDIALKIEERLWIDVAARYHPEMGVVAGPYSRAYTMDTVASVSSFASLLWFVLGEGVNPSPMELFNPDPKLVLHHQHDLPFNIAQQCWFASGTYHIPDKALEMLRTKQYPFRAIATAEHGDAGPDFPARPMRLETYLQRDFTVGTSDVPLLSGGQAAAYFATYKRTDAISSFRDVGTVFHKFLIDDEIPGHVPPSKYSNNGEQDNLESRCSNITLQSNATMMMLTHPHLSLGGAPDTEPGSKPPKPISRLNEMVIFPTHYGACDELMIGDRLAPDWSGEAAHGEWIACRRGKLLIAIRPMAYSKALGHATTSLERNGDYDFIRTTFYHGDPKQFSRAELRGVFGGFVAEHASTEDFASLAEFAAAMRLGKFTDFLWTTRRARYRRPATGKLPAVELETSWSPGSPLPRFMSVNCDLVATPKVQIDGIDAATLPFLDTPPESVPGYFPWERLEVIGSETNSAIGDREV